jgi:hypothetical protein
MQSAWLYDRFLTLRPRYKKGFPLLMAANPLHSIEQIESSLWEAADQLRANSKLTSSEY